ncbi:MAG: multicopper oxidase family protein [Deltaproteobacteria bacterium]|nr:multicopper oxidase family protein [Deltaproteobacteria bacterium]
MPISRRAFLKAALGAAAASGLPSLPVQRAFAAADRKVHEFEFVASIEKVKVGGGPEFKAWTYNGQAPGPLIRVPEGDVIRVKLINRLPMETTVHWHGLPVPNGMDGVPNVTQDPVPPGGEFLYEFTAEPAGTFMYHSHVMYQLDQGLIGGLIIDPRKEKRGYDQEEIVVLDDVVMRDDGATAPVPRRPPMGMGMGMGMGGGMMGMGDMMGMGCDMMGMGGTMAMGGTMGMGGMMPLLEPIYDGYAVNGNIGAAIKPIVVNKGDRIKLRILNPSSATIYYLQLSGHPMVITHTDSRPVQPIATDILRIAMGERYDVEVIANNPGHWVLAAMERGYGESRVRIPFIYKGIRDRGPMPPDFGPGRRMITVWDMQAPYPLGPRPGPVHRLYPQMLSGGMHSPYWTINGMMYPNSEKLSARLGERVRFGYRNHSMMPHPMHLHGHFFKIVNPALPPELWIMKDTVIVDPMQYIEIEYVADNPGNWIHHCHNLYHMEAGMANLALVLG